MARNFLLLLLAVMPSAVKIPLYRHLLGWKIGCGVRIGLSFIDAREVTLGDHVRIGRFNRLQRIPKLEMRRKASIGNRNVFMTARPELLEEVREGEPRVFIGEDSHVIGPHFFDVHAPLRLGNSVVIAGRGSSFYTHGVDYRRACLASEPIDIGENSYIGAHCLFAPGARIAPNTIVGMGALVTKAFDEEYVLVGGSPARVLKELDRSAKFFTRPRPDFPNGRNENETRGDPE